HEHDSGDPDDDREPQGPASPLGPRHLGHPPPDVGTRTFTWLPGSQHNPPSRVPLRKKPPASSTCSTPAPRRFPRSSGRSPSEPQEGRLTIQPGAGGRAEQGSATDCSSVEQRGASLPIQVAERSLSSSARGSRRRRTPGSETEQQERPGKSGPRRAAGESGAHVRSLSWLTQIRRVSLADDTALGRELSLPLLLAAADNAACCYCCGCPGAVWFLFLRAAPSSLSAARNCQNGSSVVWGVSAPVRSSRVSVLCRTVGEV
ncbi:hypothetical protein HPB47_024300, partial [Ixodes persulcatus]